MRNDYLLIKNNYKESNSKIKFRDGKIEFKLNSSKFNGFTIKEILIFVNMLEKKYKFLTKKHPVHFNLGEIVVEDKLTYIIFECICNYLIETKKYNVIVSFDCREKIYTEGILLSPLNILRVGHKDNDKEFMKMFKKKILKTHYRRVVGVTDSELENLMLPSKIMTEVDSFLKYFNLGKRQRDAIAEVIAELVGNVLEHAQTECLIDLDIAEGYKKGSGDESYYGINITIINFSDRLLGDSISEKITTTEILNKKHLKLLDAYKVHRKSFSKNYLKEDFYNIASFQHKISGRMSNESTGGTGLTKLINRLEKYSDAYFCYVITGDRAIFFLHEYLSYNEEEWIGFNEENDFLNNIPNEDILGTSKINMPGTAYNLNFILKSEEILYEK